MQIRIVGKVYNETLNHVALNSTQPMNMYPIKHNEPMVAILLYKLTEYLTNIPNKNENRKTPIHPRSKIK